jgi:prepilin-type N-terminal cleavage/methylation domain-containing protein
MLNPLQHFRKNRGFTLLEMLLTIALAAIVAGFTFSTGFDFLRTQNLDESANNMIETLRRAQIQALTQKNDSSFGVRILSDSYILFEGDSYAARNLTEDESFTFAANITPSGLDEVVFAKLTGIPSATGLVTLTLDSASVDLDINSHGKIEKQ